VARCWLTLAPLEERLANVTPLRRGVVPLAVLEMDIRSSVELWTEWRRLRGVRGVRGVFEVFKVFSSTRTSCQVRRIHGGSVTLTTSNVC
jgi:hypothetical protein